MLAFALLQEQQNANRYRLLKVLGSGAYGTVYMAEPRLDGPVHACGLMAQKKVTLVCVARVLRAVRVTCVACGDARGNCLKRKLPKKEIA